MTDTAPESLISERDYAENMAGRLANAIAPTSTIGEHSPYNDPWQNALDLATPAAVVERLRARTRELEEQIVALHAENTRLRAENREYERALGLNDSP